MSKQVNKYFMMIPIHFNQQHSDMKNQGGNFELILPVPTISLAKVFLDLKHMQKDNLNDIQIQQKQDRGQDQIRGLKFIARKIKILLQKNKKIEYNQASRILINNFASEEKAQRNIKRRVYDAINVLVSAGVINKEDNKIQLVSERHQNQKKNLISIAAKANKSDLLGKLEQRASLIKEKRKILYQLKSKINLLHKISIKSDQNRKQLFQENLVLEWEGNIKKVQINKKKKQIYIKGGKSKQKYSNLIQFICNPNTKCRMYNND